jgi:hypothetical protein
MLRWSLVMAAVRVALALDTGDSVGAAARDGTLVGAAMGVVWHWNTRRAKTSRADFERTLRVMTRPVAVPGLDLPTRRYGNWRTVALVLPAVGLFLAGVVAVALLGEEPWPAAGAFALALLCGWVLIGMLLTYTAVGPAGLRIRTPRRRTVVSWAELAEVRWDFVDGEYQLVLRTTDGREVTAAGIVIADTGEGRRRAARALAHIEAAWGRSA